MTTDLSAILGDHEFFKGMKPEHLAILAGCASNVKFEAGETLFREGEEAHQFFLLRQGRVALDVFAAGRGPITIQTSGEGEVIGWSWLFPPHHWRFSARAVEMTRAFALDGKCLREKCDRDHSLAYEILKRFAEVMSHRLDATRLQMLDVYASSGPSAKG
jgi:CRP/FNR family transcriptional regulator, cyclic AMP receptor protein